MLMAALTSGCHGPLNLMKNSSEGRGQQGELPALRGQGRGGSDLSGTAGACSAPTPILFYHQGPPHTLGCRSMRSSASG